MPPGSAAIPAMAATSLCRDDGGDLVDRDANACLRVAQARVDAVEPVSSMMPCGLELSPSLVAQTADDGHVLAHGFERLENEREVEIATGLRRRPFVLSAPCGKYMKPRRGLDAATVCASAVPAGIMASSNGRAIVAPAPLRTVRRDRCFFVKNITGLLRSRLISSLPALGRGCRLRACGTHRLKPRQGRWTETIVSAAACTDDAANGGHVAVVEASTERIGHQVSVKACMN